MWRIEKSEDIIGEKNLFKTDFSKIFMMKGNKI